MPIEIKLCAIFFSILIPCYLCKQSVYSVGNYITVDLSDKKITVTNGTDTVLVGDLGCDVPPGPYTVVESTSFLLEVQWNNNIYLLIQTNGVQTDSTVAVYDIIWTGTSIDQYCDRYYLSPYHWYGATEYGKQQGWTLENHEHLMNAYVTGEASAMERYWLSSSQVALTVADDVPLTVSVNQFGDGYLQFIAKYFATIYANLVDSSVKPFLKYKIWIGVGSKGQSLKNLHLNVVNKYYGLAQGIPDQLMLKSPVWSTWARYKQAVNQTKVLDFAREILANNFTNCQLEIDDQWATAYGDMTFDPVKFPDAKGMVDQLHEMGFRVTVWVHPFANMFSATANDTANFPYWVTYPNGTPAWVSWWDGVGYILDATNPSAVQWFVNRLNVFKAQYGVDSFKFDAGETNWLGLYFTLYNATFPNHYSTEYTKLASQLGTAIEARSNTRNQGLPNFMRILDRDSNWGYNNGIKTVIPVSLIFGLMNRPFILPDMIGGNAYGPAPDRELYIRWAQANIFLPALQFSIAPWDYDDECVEICRQAVSLHEQYIDVLVNLSTEATVNGSPIIRPLWWTGDESEEAVTCDSQFLFGDLILVAPILDSGIIGRNVYLPSGYKWKSVLDGNTYDGGQTITQEASLSQLAYFFRVDK